MERAVSSTLTTLSHRENLPVSVSKKLDGNGSKWRNFIDRIKTYVKANGLGYI
jgi:hypothetical protein